MVMNIKDVPVLQDIVNVTHTIGEELLELKRQYPNDPSVEVMLQKFLLVIKDIGNGFEQMRREGLLEFTTKGEREAETS